MKFSLAVMAILISSIIFVGCGESSSSGGGVGGSGEGIDASNGGSGEGIDVPDGGSSNLGEGTPVTTKIVCDPDPYVINNTRSDSKYAADGDITATCKTYGKYTFGEYGLKSGVESLTIEELKKVEYTTIKTDVAKGSSTTTYDYKAGTVRIQENYVVEGKTYKYDCVETYPSPLPTTITDDTIEDLFDWEGNDYDRISTTCPDSYYEEGEEDDSEDLNWEGKVEELINYTATDSNGKEHLFSITISVER